MEIVLPYHNLSNLLANRYMCVESCYPQRYWAQITLCNIQHDSKGKKQVDTEQEGQKWLDSRGQNTDQIF